jgi:hypothetical protein
MRLVTFCILSALLVFGAEQKFWLRQDVTAWTPQQVTEFTSASPWAKQVSATLVSNDSNMASGMPGSGGGGRVGRGGHYSSSTPAAATLPNWQATVRWASAKPMRRVLKRHLLENFAGRYVISVSGLPISGNATEMAEQTTLQLKRGDPVHPESAYQDPTDTSTIYFAFLPSMIDVSNGKTALFNMLASPYDIKAIFNLGDMKYLGEPSF